MQDGCQRLARPLGHHARGAHVGAWLAPRSIGTLERRERHMPPRGVKSPKRKRQYEKIKKSERSRGRSPKVAKRIAAAPTNKTRRRKGETKSSGGRKKTKEARSRVSA